MKKVKNTILLIIAISLLTPFIKVAENMKKVQA